MNDQLSQFKGFRRANQDFERVQNQLNTELLAYQLDLTNSRTFAANTFADLPFAGNAFYVDQNSDVGNASVLFANQPLAGTIVPAFVQSGFIAKVPFTRLMIANSAQPGKFLRFFYGVDIDFTPSINQSLTIAGTVNVAEQASLYGASFASTTGLNNSNEQILAPASNLNGVIIWACSILTASATAAQPTQLALIAKSSAPATAIDGDVLLMNVSLDQTAAGELGKIAILPRPIRVAAGKGLYFRNGVAQAEAIAYRSIQYTVL